MRPSQEVIRLGRALAVLALVTYVATAGGSLTTSDAVVSFEVTRGMVDHGTVAVPEAVMGWDAQRGRDGRFYSPFGVAQAVLHVPVYAAAKAFEAATGLRVGKPDTLAKGAVALSQTLVVAALVWLTFHAAAARPAASVTAATLAALALAFGSSFWPYSKFGFNQPLAALVLLAAVHDAFVGLTRDPSRLWRAGAWVGLAVHVRHELVLAALPLAAWIVRQSPSWTSARAALMRFAPGLALGVAGWLGFNAWRFGNPFDPGYLNDETVGFFGSMGEGMLGLLVSPGASLFAYSPVAALGAAALGLWLWRSRSSRRGGPDTGRLSDGLAWLLAGIVVVFVLFYASLGSWSAGRSYGPRYLLVVLPLLVLSWAWWLDQCSTRAARWMVAFALGIGVVVQVPGLLVDYAKVSQALPRATAAEREWTLAASPWMLNARALGTVLPRNLAYLSGAEARPALPATGAATDRGFSQQFSFSVDFWWAYLFYLGVYPVPGVWAIAGGLCGAWILAARHAWRAYQAATRRSSAVAVVGDQERWG